MFVISAFMYLVHALLGNRVHKPRLSKREHVRFGDGLRLKHLPRRFRVLCIETAYLIFCEVLQGEVLGDDVEWTLAPQRV